MCWQCVLIFAKSSVILHNFFLVWIGNNETEISSTVAAVERKGLPNFSAHTIRIYTYVCVCMLKLVFVYNWVCRYETKIIKAKRKCNFNFRCAHAHALRLYARERFVYTICLHCLILFITFYFTFVAIFFSYFSIPFLLPAHNIHSSLFVLFFFCFCFAGFRCNIYLQ